MSSSERLLPDQTSSAGSESGEKKGFTALYLLASLCLLIIWGGFLFQAVGAGSSPAQTSPAPHAGGAALAAPVAPPADPAPLAVPAALAAPAVPAVDPGLDPAAASAASVSDVLTDQQKQRIHDVSLTYVADSEARAIQVARQMNFVQGDGHPSNMCGPLSIAILQGAGLLSPYLDLHDFWLISTSDSEAWQWTFTEDRFTHYQFSQCLCDFDFRAFPLRVGDLLYIRAGLYGSFDHVLVVTRVDAARRAYSTTNFNTPNGFVIQETMLYDPSYPGVGKLYDWTNRANYKLGLTGFGGFDLWRLNTPVAEPTADEKALAERVDRVLNHSGGEWHILVQEVGGRALYSRLDNYRIQIGPGIGLPIALLFFKSLELRGIDPADFPDFLDRRGYGRSYARLLSAMLENSDEEATQRLLEAISDTHLDMGAALESWGADHTSIADRYSTADDLDGLLQALYTGQAINSEGRHILLELLAAGGADDGSRLGVIRPRLPPGGQLYDRRTTISNDQPVLGDAAILTWPSSGGTKAYTVIIFGSPGTTPVSEAALTEAIESVSRILWDYFRRAH
jgi:hypothetical protein